MTEGVTLQQLPGIRRVEQIMGMPVSVQLCDDWPSSQLHHLAEAVFDWWRHVDAVFSTYRPDSVVCQLRDGRLQEAQCDREVRRVLRGCAALREATGGYFDAYAGGQLDPSGYVKGWSVQVAADRLAAVGLRNFFLDAGGDIVLRGHPYPGQGWRVGIEHPFRPDRLAWVLELTDTAVATSGTYARGEHILDPHTGQPATALTSVTVIGSDLATVDGYATAAVAMGESGTQWLATLADTACAVVTADGRAFRSENLPVAAADPPPAPVIRLGPGPVTG